MSLTPRGRALARKVPEALASLEARVAERVSAADLAGFAAVVEALQSASLTTRREKRG